MKDFRAMVSFTKMYVLTIRGSFTLVTAHAKLFREEKHLVLTAQNRDD